MVTPMRVLVIVHQPDAGPGVFAHAIRDAGAAMDAWLIPEAEPPGDPFDYDAVLTLGGAMHADQEDDHPWLAAEKQLLAELMERAVPLMGVCLGAQLMADAAGAQVGRAKLPEIGWYEVKTSDHADDDPILGPLAPGFTALEWHSYEFLLPAGATPLASSAACLQAYRIGGHAWGIQFHAEVTDADFEAWIDDYRSDPDAAHIDAGELRSRTREAIADWNELGMDLMKRFLAVASAQSAP
jgi:GMP synthase-like glutamine amidotransferase